MLSASSQPARQRRAPDRPVGAVGGRALGPPRGRDRAAGPAVRANRGRGADGHRQAPTIPLRISTTSGASAARP